jgi:hypothetical protein
LKKVRLTPEQQAQLEDKEFFHDAEVLGQLPGKLLLSGHQALGFNIGKLVSIHDGYVSWSVQNGTTFVMLEYLANRD